MNIATITAFSIYLILMLIIGVIGYYKTNSLSDYILGGRNLNSWVAAFSAQASDMSGWLLLGLPGAAYATGLNAMWIAIGLAIGTYLNWQFIAQRLRRYTEITNNSLTLSDYFENRFKDKTHLLRIISAILILIFYLFYTASGLVAGGKLFEASFGLNYNVAVLIGAFVIICYTFLGGFLAVSYTDFIKGSLMFLALLFVPITMISNMGGFGSLWNTLGTINVDLLDATKTVAYDFANNIFWVSENGDFSLLVVISLMAWGLGYFGQPHILARFMGIRSAKDVPKAQLIAVIWVVLTLWGALFVGFCGISFFSQPLQDPEQVFIMLVKVLYNPWIAGLLLAAVLAAIMSTIDSQLLVASSALTEDFYKAFFRKNASQKELIWVGRLAVILIAVLALVLAKAGGSVLNLVAYAWAGFGATFGPAILCSLFWKRTTGTGVLWGMIVGGATVIIWKNFIGLGVYEIIPGFILSILTIYLVSIFGKEPDEEIKEQFNRAIKPLENE
jgi:sodium/proline symporter